MSSGEALKISQTRRKSFISDLTNWLFCYCFKRREGFWGRCALVSLALLAISLDVREQLGMVVIHLENSFEGELILQDGLPKTTKADDVFHGFGVRSIQMVAERYMGSVAVLPRGGIFNLNITIPLPEKEA